MLYEWLNKNESGPGLDSMSTPQSPIINDVCTLTQKLITLIKLHLDLCFKTGNRQNVSINTKIVPRNHPIKSQVPNSNLCLTVCSIIAHGEVAIQCFLSEHSSRTSSVCTGQPPLTPGPPELAWMDSFPKLPCLLPSRRV